MITHVVTHAAQFLVLGVAQAKGSIRAFVPRGWNRPVLTSTNPKLKAWEKAVRAACLDAMQTPIEADTPVSVVVEFFLPRPQSMPKTRRAHTVKPDVDKLLRACLDGMAGVAYHDDKQVVEAHARKDYAAVGYTPCARITVAPAAVIWTWKPEEQHGQKNLTETGPLAGDRADAEQGPGRRLPLNRRAAGDPERATTRRGRRQADRPEGDASAGPDDVSRGRRRARTSDW